MSTSKADASDFMDCNDAEPSFSMRWIVLRLSPDATAISSWDQERSVRNSSKQPTFTFISNPFNPSSRPGRGPQHQWQKTYPENSNLVTKELRNRHDKHATVYARLACSPGIQRVNARFGELWDGGPETSGSIRIDQPGRLGLCLPNGERQRPQVLQKTICMP